MCSPATPGPPCPALTFVCFSPTPDSHAFPLPHGSLQPLSLHTFIAVTAAGGDSAHVGVTDAGTSNREGCHKPPTQGSVDDHCNRPPGEPDGRVHHPARHGWGEWAARRTAHQPRLQGQPPCPARRHSHQGPVVDPSPDDWMQEQYRHIPRELVRPPATPAPGPSATTSATRFCKSSPCMTTCGRRPGGPSRLCR